MGFIEFKKRLTCWLCFKSIRMSDRQSSVTHPIMSVSGSRISWSLSDIANKHSDTVRDVLTQVSTKTRQHSGDCHHHGDSKDRAHRGAAQWSSKHGEDMCIMVVIILKIAWLRYSHGHCSYCCRSNPRPNPKLNNHGPCSLPAALADSRPLCAALCSQCYKGNAANKWWIHPILLFRPRQDGLDDALNKTHNSLSNLTHKHIFISFPHT